MENIPTRTPSELRSALEESWAELFSAIRVAENKWDDRLLIPEDDDSAAWSPRHAAWHAVAGELFRTAYLNHVVSRELGLNGGMMQFAASPAGAEAGLDALGDRARATRTTEEMLAAGTEAREASVRFIDRLTSEDLNAPATLGDFMQGYLKLHGQVASNDVRGSLVHGAVHLRDHARQIAAGSDQ